MKRWKPYPWGGRSRAQFLYSLSLPFVLLALTGLLILLLSLINTDGGDNEPTQQELAATATALAKEHSQGEDLPSEPPAGVFMYPQPESLPAAVVLNVIDGDTIEVQLEGKRETVRYYGIDTPERDKLLAATHDLEGMRKYIGSDSLAFLSIEGLYKAMGHNRRDPDRPQYTDHCFTGEYPTALTDKTGGDAPKQLSLLAEAS